MLTLWQLRTSSAGTYDVVGDCKCCLLRPNERLIHATVVRGSAKKPVNNPRNLSLPAILIGPRFVRVGTYDTRVSNWGRLWLGR